VSSNLAYGKVYSREHLSFSLTCGRSAVFSRYSGSLQQRNWRPQYIWYIAESGTKYHIPLKKRVIGYKWCCKSYFWCSPRIKRYRDNPYTPTNQLPWQPIYPYQSAIFLNITYTFRTFCLCLNRVVNVLMSVF
jgi:hypothetical protein